MSITTDRQDGLSSATAQKGPCRLATTANLLLLQGLLVIDGVQTVADDRVLVKNQSAPAGNGIYVVDTGNWRRSADFSRSDDIATGTKVFVTGGNTNAGKEYYVTTTGTINVGLTAINFAVNSTILGDVGPTGADLLAATTYLEAQQIIYPPVAGVTIKLSDYIRANPADPVQALFDAHVALFAISDGPALLDCEGIPIDITETFVLGPTDVTMGNTRANRVVSNLNLLATGASWGTLDYMYSVHGQTDVAFLRYFTLDRPAFDLSGKDLVALHITGYYHYTCIQPRIRGMGDNSIGIYSSRWARTSGVSSLISETVDGGGNPVSGDLTDGVDNSNHGCAIIEPDIRGTSGNEDQITAIYTEDGDFNVSGGWLSWLRTGIWTKRGGLNTRGIHFSMADKLVDAVAVRCSAPRGISLQGDELDGCVYVFDNPIANSYSQGVAYEGYTNIAINGFKFTSVKDKPAGTLYGGIVNIRTNTANNYVKILSVSPDWARQTGAYAHTKDLVSFRSNGAGSWDASQCTDFGIFDPGGFGILGIGSQVGMKNYIARSQELSGSPTSSDQAGLSYNYKHFSQEFFRQATINRPAIRAEGDELVFGHNVAGTWTERLRMKTTGLYSQKVLAVFDGIAAPSAVTNFAQIYVDTADGDLKVVFSDGTVKTIVVDT